MITDFIERGRTKPGPSFTFVESLSTNVAKPHSGAEQHGQAMSRGRRMAARLRRSGKAAGRAVERLGSTELRQGARDAQRFEMSDIRNV